MNDYADERAAVLRLNMAIVEERTCQWSLFQRSLRDLDEALIDDLSNVEFNQVKESYHSVAEYVKHVKKLFILLDSNYCRAPVVCPDVKVKVAQFSSKFSQKVSSLGSLT